MHLVLSPQGTSDESLEDFFNLCINFGSDGLDPTYDPWRGVDHFHRSKIYKRLSACYKEIVNKRNNPRTPRVRTPAEPASELVPLRPSTRVSARSCFGSVSKSAVAKGVESLQQGSSKN